MKKNFKRVTDIKNVAAGQFYIRAIINCHGCVWFEIFRVFGKPFKTKEMWLGGIMKSPKPEVKVLRKETGKHSKFNILHIETLLSSKSETSALFRYGNDIMTFLNDNKNNRRALMSLFKGSPVNDLDMATALAEWEHFAYMDDIPEFNRMYLGDSSVVISQSNL